MIFTDTECECFICFCKFYSDFDKLLECTSWMPDESKPPTLYKGQKDTPFFHLGKKSEISLDDVIDILLKEHSAQYVCHKQPMHVQQNAIFLINVSAISLQDLPADDNGTYRHNGMRTWVFEVENDIGGRIKKKMVAKTALKPERQLRNDQENIPQEQIL